MSEVQMNAMKSPLPSISEARIVSSTGDGYLEPSAETPYVIELGEVSEGPYYNGQDL